LFTPIRITAVASYASGPVKVRLSFRSQNVPPPPPKPLHKYRYTRRHLVSAHIFQLTNRILTLRALIIASSEVSCGLKYQHWPMKRKLFLDQVVSGALYLYNSDKSNAQKSDIPTNIDVCMYRGPHRLASCSAAVICRGCGVVTCNRQPSVDLGTLE
jgi:hypothetical protein